MKIEDKGYSESFDKKFKEFPSQKNKDIYDLDLNIKEQLPTENSRTTGNTNLCITRMTWCTCMTCYSCATCNDCK